MAEMCPRFPVPSLGLFLQLNGVHRAGLGGWGGGSRHSLAVSGLCHLIPPHLGPPTSLSASWGPRATVRSQLPTPTCHSELLCVQMSSLGHTLLAQYTWKPRDGISQPGASQEVSHVLLSLEELDPRRCGGLLEQWLQL